MKNVFPRTRPQRHYLGKRYDRRARAMGLVVTHDSPRGPSASEVGQVTARSAAPGSPVQSRLRWMEIATRLLLLASVAIFAWAALSVFVRPIARRLIEEPRYSRSPLGDDGHSESPVDFYRSDDEDDDLEPPARARGPLPSRPRIAEDDDSDDEHRDGGKVSLVAGRARKESKLFGQPSERSAEIGAVRAGESIFVMKESTDWVLVLRGEGAMLGWMRRDNLESR